MFPSRCIPALALALISGAWTAPARAQTVLDTFGPNNTTGSTLGPVIASSEQVVTHAEVRFTPSQTGPLRTITIALQSIDSTPVSAAVDVVFAPDVAGLMGPDTELIHVPATTVVGPTPVLVTVSSALHPILQSGTPYWIGLRAPMGTPMGVPVRWCPGVESNLGSPTWHWCTWYYQSDWSCTPIYAEGPPATRILIEGPGACCAPDTTCAILTAAQCVSFGGTFQGNGVACDNPCPLVLAQGACCRGATCTLANSLGCAISGGHFLGESAACTTAYGANSCCAADFNNSGSATIADIFGFISVWFRACP